MREDRGRSLRGAAGMQKPLAWLGTIKPGEGFLCVQWIRERG